MARMKDSGVSSFGKVPADWEVKKLKHILTQRSIKSGGIGDLLSVYLDRGVIPYDESTGKQVHKPSKDLTDYQIVKFGDFVLNNQQAWRGSVGVSKYNGIISPAYCVYSIDNSCDRSFMNYILRDKSMVQQYEIASRGVGFIQRNIYCPALMNTLIVLPKITDQKKIAAFLDAKCAEVDALTTDIEKQIETLEEYKKSVITEAVTKGLDPTVPMKDSGIPSFGKVPADWEVKKLKHILTQRSIKSGGVGDLLSVYLDRGVIPYGESTGKQVHKPSKDLSDYQIVKIGDFVLNNQQAWRGSVGVSKYCGIISPAYCVYSIDDSCDRNFMNYLLRDKSMVQQYEIASRGVGSIQRNIYCPALMNTSIVLPNITEQKIIANFLYTKCSHVEVIISLKHQQLETLAEYKKSLIYEYVTGKKEVPA